MRLFTAVKRRSVWVVGGIAAVASSAASATVPAIVGTTLTSVQTDGLAMVDLVWPVMITIFGALLLMKLFKKAANKI